MPIEIDPQKPTQRNIGLLTDLADTFEWGDRVAAQNLRVYGYGCDGLERGEEAALCYEPDFELVDNPTASGFNHFGAFYITANVACSTLTVDNVTEWLQGRLNDIWDPWFSEQIAAELEQGGFARQVPASAVDGAGLVDSPSLANSATVVGDGPVAVTSAVAAIERGLADRLHGARGLVHVPVEVLAISGNAFQFRNGQWETRTGHRVVADAGYVGVAPGEEAESTGVRWIYGSGPVRYATKPEDLRENGIGIVRNVGAARILAHVVLDFEPCAVVAAAVELPDGVGS